MLNSFDWVRRSRTGAELLATLQCLEEEPGLLLDEQEIGPPHSALHGPCQRCWIYPRKPSREQKALYCQACQAILDRARTLGPLSRQSVVVWGFVNRLPRQLQEGFRDSRIVGIFIHDDRHFLVMLPRKELKPFIQELVLYHGPDLKGLLQIVPTVGTHGDVGMADALCRLVHHEVNFSMDRLRVRFYSAPYQVTIPHVRDRQGILTFDVTEFLSALEMAAVFRTVMRPEEQTVLYELLKIDRPDEAAFYWGRLMGFLSQEAKDMLSAWNVRHWSRGQVRLLYELIEYVAFYQSD